MENLKTVLTRLRESCEPGASLRTDVHALRQAFAAEFERLPRRVCFSADVDLFCSTLYGWASGGIEKVLPNAADRYRAKTWLAKSFFEQFPEYGFLQPYDLSEYPSLQRELAVAEQQRILLLEAIRLYEAPTVIEVSAK